MRRVLVLTALVGLLPVAPGNTDFQPRQKNCVGNPPRQTVDPLSPTCVPFFDDDNGGATARGVTRDEIRVVLYNDLGISGDMNEPYSSEDDPPESATGYQTQNLIRTVKAQLRYFLEHFQTYGRTVHVIAQRASGGLSSPCAQRAADADLTRLESDPFAVVILGDNTDCYIREIAGIHQIMVLGYNLNVRAAVYRELDPSVWSFAPAMEAIPAASASFICRKLFGRPAKFTRDPLLVVRPRSFGLIRYARDIPRGPQFYDMSELLIRGMKRRCGLEFAAVETIVGGGEQDAADIMRNFKIAGITTVVCYCVPVQTELTVTKMQNAATLAAYFPEWFFDWASRMDRPMWEEQFQGKLQTAFGASWLWRDHAFRDQYHYRAFKEQEPDASPNTRFDEDIYLAFLNLFTAIQQAGPGVTAPAVKTGLQGFAVRNLDNPFLPSGGFEPETTTPHTFVDTFMAWWWDPLGTPPGGKPGQGCVRVADEGRRVAIGDWPIGDDDLFVSDAPCTAGQHQLNDL